MPHQSMANETEERNETEVEATMDGGLCRLDLPGVEHEEEASEVTPPEAARTPPRTRLRTGR
jgi:hypothetical protein